MNASLLKLRLSQYGMVWVAAFVSVLLLGLAATFGLRQDFVAVADLALRIAFGALALIAMAFAAATVIAPEKLGTKVVLLLLGAVLLLPLLWSPVLAVVITAHLTGAAVEYSEVYAQFRAVVSRIVFPIVQAVFGGSLIEEVWSGFEVLATVVGFIASTITLWQVLRGALARERSAA
jgi:hypothetical protein